MSVFMTYFFLFLSFCLSLFAFPLSTTWQHAVSLCPLGIGAALPIHLAAHLCARAARQHAGHQLFSHALPYGGALTISVSGAGAAH